MLPFVLPGSARLTYLLWFSLVSPVKCRDMFIDLVTISLARHYTNEAPAVKLEIFKNRSETNWQDYITLAETTVHWPLAIWAVRLYY
jgi:hypothetical protein